MIYFKQPRLDISINEDIKAENLKAHAIVYIAWLARPIVMDQVGLNRNQSFDYYITHFRFEGLNIDAIARNSYEYAFQGPLVAGLSIS